MRTQTKKKLGRNRIQRRILATKQSLPTKRKTKITYYATHSAEIFLGSRKFPNWSKRKHKILKVVRKVAGLF